MNVQSNTYTFVYASVMVIVVAALLSVASISLQPMQKRNKEIEKKQNILKSVGIEATVADAEAKYDEFIVDSYVLNAEGAAQEGVEAFDVDMKAQTRLDAKDRKLPIYKCEKEGNDYFIVPLYGKGLWGPVWGFMSLESDMNTVYGAIFDHEGETPGLGAEITQSDFQDPFKGKTLFEGDVFNSIIIYKGGKGAAALAGDTNHGVDAISGGTITSKGVEDMIKDCLLAYETYFKQNKN